MFITLGARKMDNQNQKLSQYDVDGSLYAMMRAAKAKQDKEHMKLCMEEAQKRKKDLALIMKDMPMEKAQSLKEIVADKLAKSFEGKELSQEDQELISVDVMLKAAELEKSQQPLSPESQSVMAAAGAEVIQDPTEKKEVQFSPSLFQNFQIGSTIKNQANGQAVLDSARKPNQDYVATAAKTKNQAYTEEQLKAELSQKK